MQIYICVKGVREGGRESEMQGACKARVWCVLRERGIYIYTCRDREREKERKAGVCVCVSIYLYIHTYTYTYVTHVHICERQSFILIKERGAKFYIYKREKDIDSQIHFVCANWHLCRGVESRRERVRDARRVCDVYWETEAYVHIHTCIHTERERKKERKTGVCVCVCIYLSIYLVIYLSIYYAYTYLCTDRVNI